MSESIEYIESESFVVGNQNCPVVTKETALIAIDMEREETKKKCKTAFRGFILRAVLNNVSGGTLDLETEFERTMSEL